MEHEALKNGTLVFTDKNIRLCSDPLLLARFCRVKPSERVLDIGCGCGAVPLALRDGGFSGEITAVDIDADACSLAEAGSGGCCPPFAVLNVDVRTLRLSRPVDLALCNPPFFSSGEAGAGYRGGARHDLTLSLGELCACCARLVRFGGRLCVCIRPERLEDLMCALRENGFSTKRLRFARHTFDAVPWLALVEARLGGGPGLALENDFVMYDGADGLTSDAKEIFFERI